MNASFVLWLKGIVSTAISAAAGGVALIVVDPNSFNFGTGARKLGEVCGALALVHVAAYLQKSPIWGANQADAPAKP
jgi:hypothetical protein